MTDDALNLDPDCCRQRQQRTADLLPRHGAEWAVFTTPEMVQYLTGFRPHRLMQAAVVLDAGGRCLLSAPNSAPEHAAADDVVTFAAQRHATLRQDQAAAALTSLAEIVGTRLSGRLGIEASATTVHVMRAFGIEQSSRLVDLDEDLWQIRRAKDPDELVMIRRAIACTDAMYETAREIITPGITELEVFNQLHAAAVAVAGEPLVALGNDYQCNSPGGAPRRRRAQAGELFILDLGPSYRGYYADNCRTIAVDGDPTDVQQQAWEAIVDVLEMVQQTVRPGVSARELFETADAMLRDQPTGTFGHHLGHGFGLFPHEAPHLNPHWNDRFAEGDTFTAEPGLYGPMLRAGIRLEQNYRVTADGVERLTSHPLEL